MRLCKASSWLEVLAESKDTAVGGKAPDGVSGPLPEQVIRAGFFDEQWRISEPARRSGKAGK
jgi:hypothetical protein